MKNELLAELDQTSDELFRLLPSFSPEQFNEVPFEGSWTPGQVAAHLSMSETGVSDVLFGATKPTTERPDDQHVGQIRDIFLDFSTKLKSPDFIIPREPSYDQAAMIAAFRSSREKIRQALQQLDLSETVMDFEFPGLGRLTRLEMINFAICHGKRHTNQLKNIARKMEVV